MKIWILILVFGTNYDSVSRNNVVEVVEFNDLAACKFAGEDITKDVLNKRIAVRASYGCYEKGSRDVEQAAP